MCATAKRALLPPGIAVRLLFCILAVCLGAHFLAEDALLPAFQPGASNAVLALHLNESEAGHLDDLAVLPRQSEMPAWSALPVASAGTIHAETWPRSPILLPPRA